MTRYRETTDSRKTITVTHDVKPVRVVATMAQGK